MDRQKELVNVLLIGETAKSTAKFMRHFTEGNTQPASDYEDGMHLKPWTTEEVRDLVKSSAAMLRWNETFMVCFHLLFANSSNLGINILLLFRKSF
jgi:hypothetical protein